jgi:glycosyltransferase involved in cell wall biosynthesis
MGKSPTVVFVLNRIAAGGAEAQVRRVSVGLSERGWQVTIISLSKDTVFPTECVSQNIERVNLMGPLGWRAVFQVFRLRRELRRQAPAVCVSMMIPADPVARLACLFSGLPLISSLRNEYIGGWVVNLALFITSWIPICVTTNTVSVKQRLGPKVTPWWRSIEVVPNAVQLENVTDLPVVRREVRRELGVSEDTFLWVAVGAQTPQKNYLGLLEALKLVPDSNLLIVGADFQKAMLTIASESLGLAQRVSQLGRRNDVARLLIAADGFVQASDYEGMPNAVMEAMFARKPIVATAVGGVPELIETGVSGILVAPKSPHTLAQAMRSIEKMGAIERASLGERAHNHVLSNHSLPVVVDQWEWVIQRAWKRAKRQIPM